MTRILVVESIDDEITRKRHEILLRSPRPREYSFSYCYALDSDGEVPEGDLLDFLASHPPQEEDLGELIREAIQLSDPDFVLLHTGFVFRRYPEVFYAVFKTLKKEFPFVRFGYQERPGLAVDHEAFDSDAKTRDIQDLFFRRMLFGL